MNYLTADDVLLDRLSGIVEPIEIRDVSGKVLGHYTPLLSEEEKEWYARAAELFDMEEMEQRLATERGQGKTTAEVMRYLQSLERDQGEQ
jgi:hypothetical protein